MKLKILFVIRASENYFGFKSIVDSFYDSGHVVKVLFDKNTSKSNLNSINPIKNSFFYYGWANYSNSIVKRILLYTRFLLSLRRYHKVKSQSSFYAKRWERAIPSRISYFLKVPIFKKILISDFAAKFFQKMEKIMPPDPLILAEIKEFEPDIVLATPADLETSCDIDYLKAAEFLGVPTAVPVISWDNLTTKGLIQIVPDLLLVWNKTQIKEAKIHHQIASKYSKIVGSSLFDPWFSNFKPKRSKLEFCKQHQLSADAQIIVYFTSSLAIAGDERWLIRKLSRVVRDIETRNGKKLQIIVRPHPDTSKFYINFSDRKVKVLPRIGAYSDKKEIRQFLFETIYFSKLCLGINTSALIDSIICDKPTVGLLTEKYMSTQAETEHFKVLAESGALYLIEKPHDLERVLVDIWHSNDKTARQRKEFVKQYIRPYGLNVSAGERVVREVESLVAKSKP